MKLNFRMNYRRLAGALIAVILAFSLSSCAGGYTRVIVVDRSEAEHEGREHEGREHEGRGYNADKHYKTGVKLYKKGKYKRAVRQFELSINKRPKNWKSHYYLGMSLRERKAYRKSTHQFKKALKLAPRNSEIQADIYVDLGIAWERYGFLERAADSYAHALELDSDNYDARAGMKRANKKHHKKKGDRHRGERG